MTKNKKVVLFGLGEFGEVMNFYLHHDSPYEVTAFTVNGEFIKDEKFCAKPVIPFEEISEILPPSEHSMLVAIGYSRINKIREQKYNEAKAKGYSFISYVSEKATVWPGQQIGENSIIFEDNTLQAFSKIGNNVVLWSGNHIGHHSIIKDHCFLTSHVVVSGGVVVERNCFLGVNSTIRDHIRIGARSIIGMGVTILKDVPEDSIFKATEVSPHQLTTDRIRI